MSTVLERIATDAAKFVDPNTFGQAATWTHIGSPPASINVLFNEEVEIPSPEDSNILTTAPAAVCRTSNVPTAARKDTLAVDSITYYVQRVEPKAGGLSLLILSRQSVL